MDDQDKRRSPYHHILITEENSNRHETDRNGFSIYSPPFMSVS